MPGFVLTAWQLRTLLDLAGLDDPGPGSPLRAVPTFGRRMGSADPDFKPLVTQGLLAKNGRVWRVNSVLAGILRAGAHPEEVVHVGVTDPDNPGFAVVRRGSVVSECTVGRTGTTKLYFPLTRSTLLVSLVSALSGDRPEPEPLGFRFVGPAEDAFVLSAALRALRIAGGPQTVAELRESIRRDATTPRFAAPFAFTVGRKPIDALAALPRRIDRALKRLTESGHLRVEQQRLVASPAVELVLGNGAMAAFAVTRTEIAGGEARSHTLMAMRCGDRILVSRVRRHGDDEPQFEWSEVTRTELRALVAAALLHDTELEILAGANGDAAPARSRTRTAAWVPTHVVPATGMPAWPEPDPAAAAVASLDPRLEVQLVDEIGAWAQVVCSNGWSGWVDGRALERR